MKELVLTKGFSAIFRILHLGHRVFITKASSVPTCQRNLYKYTQTFLPLKLPTYLLRPTVSQTMPVSGGQHPRPPLDAGIPNRSPKLRRFVSGPTPPLPQPDYHGKETKSPGDTPVTDQPSIAAEAGDTGCLSYSLLVMNKGISVLRFTPPTLHEPAKDRLKKVCVHCSRIMMKCCCNV